MMNEFVPNWEYQYSGLITEILDSGEDRIDRTGTGTRALFSKQLDINLEHGFPLVTTKRMPFKMILSELLWFLEGSTDERRLSEIHFGTRDESKITIWTANANAEYWKSKAQYPGDLGRVYGAQWRSWRTGRQIRTTDEDGHVQHLSEQIDQIKDVINKIRTNCTDRRILVSAWNVGELSQMALPPCHMFFQFFVSLKDEKRRLSLKMYQRSVDTALGLPFNIASYALLLMMIAQVTNCTPHRLILDLGDTHLYKDHLDLAELQITREPKTPPFVLLNSEVKEIDDFKMEDFVLMNYESHDSIPYKMST